MTNGKVEATRFTPEIKCRLFPQYVVKYYVQQNTQEYTVILIKRHSAFNRNGKLRGAQ